MKMTWSYSLALSLATLSVASLVGCGGGSDSSGGSSLDAMAEALEEQAGIDAQTKKDNAAAEARSEADQLQAEADRLDNKTPTKVTVDDMKRGQRLKGGGYLNTVVRGGIRAEQKLNMHQVTSATNLFYGHNLRFPESHEEFMEKVIEYNGIKLEPLEEPYEYRYNPEDHQLYKVVKQEAIDAAKAEAEAKEAAAAGQE